VSKHSYVELLRRMNMLCEVLAGPDFIKLAVLSHDLITKGSK